MIRSLYKPLITVLAAFIFFSHCLLMASPAAGDFPVRDFQKVLLLFTNDVHGGIPRTEARFMNPDFPPQIGNGPALAAYVKQIRAEAEKEDWGLIITDAGDFFSGTPVGSMTRGAAMIEFMNAVGYDATVMGNHDFDKSWQAMQEGSGKADFPFLGANIVDIRTGTQPEWLKPWIIKDVKGIKFGIIGIATASTPSMSFPSHIENLEFLPEIPVLRKTVPEVRAAGADVIIVLSHMWLEYEREESARRLYESGYAQIDSARRGVNGMEAAAAVPGIDIMFTGHVHRGFTQPYECPVNQTLIFQNYANGSNLGHVNIYVHRESRTLAGFDNPIDNSNIITLMEDEFWIDGETDSVIALRVAEAEKGFDEVLTVLKAPLRRSGDGESVLGNMIVDAMTYASGADIAFSNFGGIRADLESGPLTPRELFRVLPFGNKITVFNVPGSFIEELMEQRVRGNSRGMLLSGMKVTVDKRKPDGERVQIQSIGGRPFDAEKIYKLAVSDYLAEGNSGYNLLTSVDPSAVSYTGIVIRQALIDYIVSGKSSSTRVDGRWNLIRAR